MRIKKVFKWILLPLFLVFFLISNFTILNIFLPHCSPYRYCSDHCNFWTYEKGKGRDPFGDVELGFKNYKSDVQNPDLILHRRFYRKWWQIWNWYDFLTHKRWSYPYAENDEDT